MKVILPTLASLRVAVYNDNGTTLLGHRILPVDTLRPGQPLATFTLYIIILTIILSARHVECLSVKKVRLSICVAHFCVRRRPAVKPPQMRSRHPGHRPQPAHTGLGSDPTVGQAAVGLHLRHPSSSSYVCLCFSLCSENIAPEFPKFGV